MTSPRLYDELAWLWPLLSPPEDYAAEAQTIRHIIRRHLDLDTLNRPPRLLELGAGGGHTLHHLADAFDCTASDLSHAMLENCQALNPTVRTVQGDMRSLRLGETFDVVLVHDAIDYLTDEADVRAALHTVHAHLNPAGLAFIAPTYVCEGFTDHAVETDQQAGEGALLTYLSYIHDPDPADTSFQMILVYLIEQAGRVRIEHDRHTCGLFAQAQWQSWMHAAQLPLIEPPPSPDDAPMFFVGQRQEPLSSPA